MAFCTNPFSSPELTAVLIKTGVVMGFGLVIMTLTQVTRLGEMARSNAFKKFCSWIVILPALLTVIYSGALPFAFFLLFVLWKSSSELKRLFHLTPFYAELFIFNQAITGVVLVFAPQHAGYLVPFYLVSTFSAQAIRNQIHDSVKQTALVVVGNLWVGYCLTLLAHLHRGEDGAVLTTVIFGMVVLADVFAYLFGGIARRTGIGKGPLAHNISPNKTVGGAFGGIAGAAIAYAVFGSGLGLPLWLGALMAALSGVGATVGDLAESAVKRTAGVKDASDLIPFHGGMLDRVDSLLLVAPICFGIVSLNRALTG